MSFLYTLHGYDTPGGGPKGRRNSTFNLRDTAGDPERARYHHLVHLGSLSQRRIRFILPAHGASHTIKIILGTKSHPT